MARKRLIDTEELYFKADLVKLLSNRGLHLYIRLWGIAEDWGGYEPKYADIALKMGALRFTTKETERFVGLLVTNKKIIEYEACGRKVHWIVNFMEHQPLDNPSPPKLPLPEWITCELLEYKSGKKYAKYLIIPEKLPVGYQSHTRNGVTVTNSNSNETKLLVPLSSDTNKIFDYFCLKYKKVFNKEYVANFGKDKKLIKDLLKIIKTDELASLINQFFESDDEFVQKSGYTLGVFKSQINKLRSKKTSVITFKKE
jgi:hypothetical protein